MVTAAACSSARPAGRVTARLASQVMNVRPAAVGGQTADLVAHLVVGHVRSDRGHHSGEVGAQLR